jgi:hypothetical protein
MSNLFIYDMSNLFICYIPNLFINDMSSLFIYDMSNLFINDMPNFFIYDMSILFISYHKSTSLTYIKWTSLTYHKLLSFPGHLSSLPVFSGVRVTRCLVVCVCFVDCYLSLCFFFFEHCVLNGEATHINFLVFGLTRPRLEPTIYRTRGEHANHYDTDVVSLFSFHNLRKLMYLDKPLLFYFSIIKYSKSYVRRVWR